MDLPIHIERTSWHPAWDELAEVGIGLSAHAAAAGGDGECADPRLSTFPFPLWALCERMAMAGVSSQVEDQ